MGDEDGRGNLGSQVSRVDCLQGCLQSITSVLRRLVNGDRFRGNSDEEIQLWNECARLVANAIIYFNSSVLSRLLDSFEHQDYQQKIEIVKQASPVAWYNINFKGTYNFELSDDLPNLEEMMRSIDGF